MNAVADVNKIGVRGWLTGGVVQDDMQSDVMAYRIDQGGFGLSERIIILNRILVPQIFVDIDLSYSVFYIASKDSEHLLISKGEDIVVKPGFI